MEGQRNAAQLKTWFDSAEFEQDYHCNAPLGVQLDEQGTHFSLWAPTAQRVRLNLYRSGSDEKPAHTAPLRREDRGLWRFDAPVSLDGFYYDYEITVGTLIYTSGDPYARACGVNGTRSMVLDLEKTNPEGWKQDKAPARQAEDVIYEIHVKDFSWDPHSGVPEKLRGKYAALTLADTTLDGKGVHPTCMNHVKRLGVTHIQLMPVYDYGSVDEEGEDDAFNWGYDPMNYNIPEGSYSSDPHHGEVRIRELKEAVMALHRNGFRVIMDVVYNHTYQLDSCLFRTAPWYFYRQKTDGSASNGSGCGTEIASERSMCARYIVDSIMYWAEEYHIDGFRFDLMGILDTALMNRIQYALDAKYGKGEKQLWGEPWAGGECRPRRGSELSHKGNLKKLLPSIAAFCDNTRDAIKGSVMNAESKGFVNGGGLYADRLAGCVIGWSGEHDDFAAPSQTITYMSCHDDWTLWDKLVYTMDEKREFTGFNARILKANRLAAAILAGCQGHLFMLSGEEFARTKEGIRDSYCSPVEINRLDWQRSEKNADLAEYYRGLIALRKQLPGLCDKTNAACPRVKIIQQLEQDAAAIVLDNSGEGSLYGEVLLAYNASAKEVPMHLPEGKWSVLADGESSFRWQKPEMLATGTKLRPMSALILGKK